MIPENINQNHILKAIREIDMNGVPKGRKSRKFQLFYNGKHYPPKYVISLANKYANGMGLEPSEFSGGQETNNFLKKLVFEVVELPPSRIFPKPSPAPRKISERKGLRHDERCPECKKTIETMLRKIYGGVEVNHKFETGTKPEDYRNSPFYSKLKEIFSGLQNHRGYKDFIRSQTLPRCDFFVPNPGFNVEFDEPQHFTACRKIALSKYPERLELGFDREKWIKLCEKIDAKDNDPPYRDEQRAWYDTLRDFIPTVKGLKPTIRMFSRDFRWCGLNPEVPSDVERFRTMIERKYRPTRIATVCIKGEPANDLKENAKRKEILKEVVKIIINKEWSNIDAIVFPGGFFYLNQHIGQLLFHDRVSALKSASFHNTCTQGCKDLSDISPRVFIIAGVDTTERMRAGFNKKEGADQLCVAWTSEGVSSIGRKVFPTKKDERNNLVCYKNDFSTDHRVIRLPSGKTAVLCACYDMFGCSEKIESPTTRTRNIRRIGEGSILHEYTDLNFKEIRKECVDSFQDLIARQQVKVGITAIHRFERPGLDGFWQRHGIATCSAELQGLGIGAAHFSKYLPEFEKSTLASAEVPKKHLYLSPKWKRQTHRLAPIDWILVDDKALVRLFEW